MKYFITSDIHGYYNVLIKELKRKNFDPDKDTLITLGDNFDRGEYNVEMYEFLRDLPHKILVRGNHEDLFINMVESNYISSADIHNGTYDTLRQFSRKYLNLVLPQSYFTLAVEDELEALKRIKETEVYKFISDSNNWVNKVEFGKLLLTHASIPQGICRSWKEARRVNPYMNRIPGKLLVAGHWFAYLGRDYESGIDSNLFLDVALESNQKDLYKPYIADDLIMIDACTPYTHKCNVLVYDDETHILKVGRRKIKID